MLRGTVIHLGNEDITVFVAAAAASGQKNPTMVSSQTSCSGCLWLGKTEPEDGKTLPMFFHHILEDLTLLKSNGPL